MSSATRLISVYRTIYAIIFLVFIQIVTQIIYVFVF